MGVCVHEVCRGVSRISARGVLKVRPHTKSGGEAGQGPLCPPPGSYASETVTILTKRVLKHFANQLICRF